MIDPPENLLILVMRNPRKFTPTHFSETLNLV